MKNRNETITKRYTEDIANFKKIEIVYHRY